MLKVILQGGLGNQLFQLAFGIARVKTVDALSFVDTNLKDTNGIEQLELSKLLFKGGYKVEELHLPRLVTRATNLAMREFAKERFHFVPCRIAKLFVESYLRGAHSIDSLVLGRGLGFFNLPTGTEYIDELAIGYFQTYRWANESGNEIRRILDLQNYDLPIELANKEKRNMVVHVRRGDYDQDGFGLLGPSYYHEGIEEIQRAMGADQILLFSDDLPYASRMIREVTNLPVKIVETLGDSALTTLRKMRGASGYVIANSSLSWWAAYLSDNEKAKVVAPSKWFKGFRDPFDLIPRNWTKLDSHFL